MKNIKWQKIFTSAPKYALFNQDSNSLSKKGLVEK